MTSPPTRRRRRLLPWVSAAVVVVLGWATWAFAVVQTPRTDRPAAVDAVLVLGGLAGPQRTERALQMAADGLTRTLVISVPNPPGDYATLRTCADPPAGVRVICFKPDPLTTRGEARELGRLAEQNDWTRVAVVTSPYHVSRSRLIVGRCFGGTVLMVPSQEPVSVGTWAYNWLYQTAGYAKAEVLRGC